MMRRRASSSSVDSNLRKYAEMADASKPTPLPATVRP
jgi:hypothetical protein